MAEEICFGCCIIFLIMTSMATVSMDDVQVVYIDLVLVFASPIQNVDSLNQISSQLPIQPKDHLPICGWLRYHAT